MCNLNVKPAREGEKLDRAKQRELVVTSTAASEVSARPRLTWRRDPPAPPLAGRARRRRRRPAGSPPGSSSSPSCSPSPVRPVPLACFRVLRSLGNPGAAKRSDARLAPARVVHEPDVTSPPPFTQSSKTQARTCSPRSRGPSSTPTPSPPPPSTPTRSAARCTSPSANPDSTGAAFSTSGTPSPNAFRSVKSSDPTTRRPPRRSWAPSS